jgi:hypothetical protein
VARCGADFAETEFVVGGTLSERRGVNVADVVTALNTRDFGLESEARAAQ